jgi:anti-anti-sigma factor
MAGSIIGGERRNVQIGAILKTHGCRQSRRRKMRTRITKEGDTTIVSMEGHLDFETAEPLRKDLNRLVRTNRTDSVPKKIIFDLENLEFVGSSGISSFVQTLKEFSVRTETKPRYCNVKSEFRRVMKAFDESEIFEFYETAERARKSFDQ